MAGNKYLANDGGTLKEVAGVQSSAGAGDAGKIPALDATGKLDSTMMPTGIGADTVTMPASEALAAGDFVNIYDDTGTVKCRKADASAASAGKPADGFVLASVENGATATVYRDGRNTQVTGKTGGSKYYLSGDTPGAATATAPSTAGYTLQVVGKADSATSISFEPSEPIVLA